MEAKRDYYAVLGVERDADDSAIKKAYRKLAKKYHPDAGVGNARTEEKFKEATKAYEILSDPEKRKLYDRFGHAAFDGSSATSRDEPPFEDIFGFGGGAAYRRAGQREDYQGMGGDGRFAYRFEDGDMEDILKNIFGGEGKDSFDRSGADVRADIYVTFEEAFFGCEKTLRLEESGGAVKTLQVRIPAGIDTGKCIRLKGKGRQGRNGVRGDLLLYVSVGEKPGFERQGMDIYSVISVPFTTAVLGGEVTVETLYGKVICKIKAGTQSGTKIRLKGKGAVSMKSSDIRGDQYVTVQIQVPQHLSEEAKRKLREFDEACGGRRRSVA